MKIEKNKNGYITGTFYSKKNDISVKFRSSYELAYLNILEKDWTVRRYWYEYISIPYKDQLGKDRLYIPDFIVLYSNNSIEIVEVKPSSKISDSDVILKRDAAVSFIKQFFPSDNISYKFITEDDILRRKEDADKQRLIPTERNVARPRNNRRSKSKKR